MDKHIPGFKIASGSLKGRKTTDDIKKVKRKHLKFDATVMPDEVTAILNMLCIHTISHFIVIRSLVGYCMAERSRYRRN